MTPAFVAVTRGGGLDFLALTVNGACIHGSPRVLANKEAVPNEPESFPTRGSRPQPSKEEAGKKAHSSLSLEGTYTTVFPAAAEGSSFQSTCIECRLPASPLGQR